MSPETEFESFRELSLGGPRAVGAKFTKPDDDWEMVLVTLGPGGFRITAIIIPTEDCKDGVLPFLEGQFREHVPRLACLVMSAWTTSISKEDPGYEAALENMNRYGVRSHPGRREVLFVQIADAGGRYEIYEAPIIRFDDLPPKLGDFARRPEMEKADTEGRMSRLLLRAFAAMENSE